MKIAEHIKEHIALGVPYLGGKALTVGNGGKFSTIQAAIDSITDGSTWEAYVPSNMPTTCTTWAINTSNLITNSFTGIFASAENYERLWFQLAGDTHKYPLETWDQNAPGGPGLRSKVPRIAADVSGSPAISYFLEKPVQIVLMDSYLYETQVNINKNISIVVSSAGRTDLGVGFKLGTSCTQGRLTLGKGLAISSTSVLSVFAISPTGRSFIFDMEYCSWSGLGTDGSSFSYLGGLNFTHVDFLKAGGTPLSHWILATGLRGDLRIKNCNLKFVVAAISGTALLFIDQLQARKTVIQGLNVELVDPNNVGAYFTLVGQSGAVLNTGDVFISGVHVSASYQTAAVVRIFDDSTTDAAETAVNHAYLTDCHIQPDLITGAKHIYRTSPVSSTMNAHVSNCSGGAIDIPSAGTLAIGSLPLGAEVVRSVTYAATITPDARLGSLHNVTALTGALTINAPLSPLIGQVLEFTFLQDATGARVITWNAAFKKAADGAGTANQVGATRFRYNGTNWIQQGGALTYFT